MRLPSGLSGPSTDRSGWFAGAGNTGTANGDVQAFALCASSGQAVTSSRSRARAVPQHEANRATARLSAAIQQNQNHKP